MCGIFGVISTSNSGGTSIDFPKILNSLFSMSESRGKESSGVAVKDNEKIYVLKSPIAARSFTNLQEYQQIIGKAKAAKNFQAIGHSRLVTNGRGALNSNNQPVVIDDDVIVHNGIVVNDFEIWKSLNIQPATELDTEAFLAKFLDLVKSCDNRLVALQKVFKEIKGNASVCILNNCGENLLLASDNGSLYYYLNIDLGIFIFASERYILQKIVDENIPHSRKDINRIRRLKANSFISLNLTTLVSDEFNFDDSTIATEISSSGSRQVGGIIDLSVKDYPDFNNIHRCSKCLLPETFPGILFDKEGVCNKCHEHKQIELKNIDELRNKIDGFRRKDGNPDCLVGLSGGRDSCYGLHVIKKELGLNPIAYTYDWGLVTDLARRNISRMCGKLGVEHILISADIHKKRNNVRKNIQAWLKKPDLSMIPLFMAGDKQFYYHAHQLRKQTGIDLFLFAAGNELERTDFKIAFSGLKGNSGEGILTKLSFFNKFKLAISYGAKFISNPRYLNSSVFDSFHAFYSSYLLKDDYFYLYHYYPWDEEIVNNTLINEYEWETSPDTTTTWRIGDGTAAFYNYIYYVVAGFTEHDTFRSNQIREGVITREQGLKMIKHDNAPRWESLRWYAGTVGFNLDEALLTIHRMAKLYK